VHGVNGEPPTTREAPEGGELELTAEPEHMDIPTELLSMYSGPDFAQYNDAGLGDWR
jgi:hypothetical protein